MRLLRWAIIVAFATCALMLMIPAKAQSVVLSESTPYTTPRIGINTCASDYFLCFLEKNITVNNPGFEGVQIATTQQVVSGNTTSFTAYNTCDQAPPNVYAGGTYYIAEATGSGNTGHSGTISANTGPNNGGGGCGGAPLFTISTAPSAPQQYDMVFVYQTSTCTNLTNWEYCGWAGETTGSGTAAIDTTSGDQFPDGGSQNLKLTLTSGSDTAGVKNGIRFRVERAPLLLQWHLYLVRQDEARERVGRGADDARSTDFGIDGDLLSCRISRTRSEQARTPAQPSP